MKIKISEASGVMLDWLVAKCEGMKPYWDENREDFAFDPSVYLCWLSEFKPSTDWAQGGPIVEREGIATDPNGPYVNGRIVPESWCAKIDEVTSYIEGPTPLIAALRCYAVSKLGEEVEVPDELA